jgi:hypothetical protein
MSEDLPEPFPQSFKFPDKSAAAFIQAIRRVDSEWHAQLPEDAQVEIWVNLIGGGQMKLGYVAEFGYNCLYIQGEDELSETYVMLAHQATLQFYCRVKKVTPEHPRKPIGFGPVQPAPPVPES